MTVPKKITLDGSTKSGTYSVTCKGDIAGNESVSVVPDATFAMSQTGKANVQAAVTQEKTMFRGSDYTGDLGDAVKMGAAAGESTGTAIDGSIAAKDLSAGAWNGAFNFTIGLEEVLDPVTLTEDNLSSYVDAETGEAIATSGDVVIPAVVKNKDTGAKYQVREIKGDEYWNGFFPSASSVTSISLPDSLKIIGRNAFAGCSNLTKIDIPEGVTEIGVNSFENCKNISEFILPEGVTSIEAYAFDSCTGMTSINIPDTVISIGNEAFRRCTNLSEININQTSNLESLGRKVISGTNVSSFYIPSNVKDIKEFEDSHGSSDGDYMSTFYGAKNLSSISVDKNNEKYSNGDDGNVLFNKETKEVIFGFPNSIIPSDAESVGLYAFQGCSGLTTIDIPSGVKKIGYKAFGSCNNLSSISIPSSLIIIEGSAFESCSSLTSIIIPNSVTIIGYDAFSGCSGLTSITIPDSVTSIEERAFYGCSGLTSITIPESVTSIKDRAFYGCSGLTSITIPESVTSIGDSAFSCCSGLTSISIPSSVTSIGDRAFSSCRNLSSITYKGQSYTSKSALTQALTDNNVTVGNKVFNSTALTD